jgi:hypothetical protein
MTSTEEHGTFEQAITAHLNVIHNVQTLRLYLSKSEVIRLFRRASPGLCVMLRYIAIRYRISLSSLATRPTRDPVRLPSSRA